MAPNNFGYSSGTCAAEMPMRKICCIRARLDSDPPREM
jgi:hypothetical protein